MAAEEARQINAQESLIKGHTHIPRLSINQVRRRGGEIQLLHYCGGEWAWPSFLSLLYLYCNLICELLHVLLINPKGLEVHP